MQGCRLFAYVLRQSSEHPEPCLIMSDLPSVPISAAYFVKRRGMAITAVNVEVISAQS